MTTPRDTAPLSAAASRAAGRGARSRRGMTVIEVLVVLAIMAGLLAVMIPTLSSVLALEQQAAASKIALAFERLHDEAVLRNKTYRVVFDLDRHRWFIEEADPGARIFSTPESREAFEKEQARNAGRDDAGGRMAAEARAAFKQLGKSDRMGGIHELPSGIFFESVYTPQHEDPVVPARERREPKPDEAPNIVAVHLFANGYVEFAVIRIVEGDDPRTRDGFSIVVDPLSGRVRTLPELVDHDDLLDFLPREGPRLP